MIRLFAALPIPDDVAETLARRQQGLPGARWRPLDTLHVTLRFFGEVAEDKAADLDLELDQIHVEPLDYVLSGAGAFGEGDEVRVVWAGVEENPTLNRLAARCEAAARRIGLKAENRAYRPHVTLAYLRHPAPARVAAWVQGHNLLKSPPIRAASFALYSSWPSDDGTRYDLEREYLLR
jgi:RNA 2',3'-cyclic 3'-phosphodiesterase